MWKTGKSVTDTTFFYPQDKWGNSESFHRLCGEKNRLQKFHNFFIHIPQPLWIFFLRKKERGKGLDYRLELIFAVMSRMLFWIVGSPFFRAISTLRMA